MGWEDAAESKARQHGGNVPHTSPLLLVLLFLGSLRRKGEIRASLQRWDDSFPRWNETEQQCISNKPGEGKQEGQVCPRHVPALWPYGPFPSTAQGKQR